ncbi:MAG: phasin family protein [Proteobacteria bacterium]|nr:phasin family protein [Pseudomonadota bacterium]
MASKMKSRRRRAVRRGAAAPDRLIGVVHQVWLAGLGAVSKAKRGTPQLLQDLIAEGARVDSQTRGAAEKMVRGALGEMQETINTGLAQVRGQAAGSFENLEKIFQTRVHRVLAQLGVPSAEDVEALGKRVDALNSSIERLGHGRKGDGSRSRAAVHRASSRAAAP